MAGLLAVSGYSLATSGDNLPYHLPVRDCGAAWEYAAVIESLLRAEKSCPLVLGYRWTRLNAWGVIPTISLKVLMKALTLL
jgi:hypothetical protein